MDVLLDQRRQVARRVARAFACHSSVASIVVFGSVATGAVDAHSDVDMLVLCQAALIPSVERIPLLETVATGWSVDVPTGNDLFAYADEGGVVDNISVTVHYQEVTWIDVVLHAVLEQGAIATHLMQFRPYTVAALLQRSWVLYDAYQRVEQWREQIKHYPTLLRHNIVQHFLPILQVETEELVACAKRGIGPRNFLFHLNRSVDALISILYAVNEVYDPADRRAATTVWPFLRKVPMHFVPRLTSILEGPFDFEGMILQAQQYSELVQEVMSIASMTTALPTSK